MTDEKQAEEALKRSEETALRLAQETGVMAEIGRIISSSLDIEEVYERFADEVRKLVPFDRIIVNLVNQQEGTLTTAYRIGVEAPGREKGVVFPIAGTVTEEMMRTGTPVLIHLESIEEVLDRFPGLVFSFQAGLRSRLSALLISRGEVIGSLALASKQEKAYGERDIWLVQGVASQIAGAIANAQLFRERKQVEKALRESEESYRSLVETSPDAIFLHDGEILVYLNPAAVRLFDAVSAEEMYGKSALDLVHPDHREAIRNRTGSIMTTGMSVPRTEIKIVRCDGSTVDVEATAGVSYYRGKKVIQVIQRDITERKRQEAALKYRAGFVDLVTSISTSFINLTSQEIDMGINSALERLGEFADVDRSYVFTFSEDGRGMSNTHEWCAPGIKPFIQRLQKMPVESLPWFYEKMKNFDLFHVPDVSELPPEAHAEKSEFEYEEIQSLIAVPMVSQRSLTGVVGFDSVRRKKTWPEDIITLLKVVGEIIANALGRKRAEEILTQSEEKYRNIFENAVEGIFQSTPGGRNLSVNPAFARMYGYESPQEVLAVITDLAHQLYVHPEDREKFRKIIEERGHIDNYETQCTCKDGSRIWVSINARVVCDAGGKVLYYEGTVEDITKRKQAEEALQRERKTFFTILENDPSGVALIGKDEVYQYLNPEFANITGYSIQDVPTGKEWMEKAYPDPHYRKNVIDAWKTDRLSQGRGPVLRLFTVTCKGGQKKEIEFRTTLLKDYTIVVLNDVTEHKRAEEKIKASLKEKEVLLKEVHHRVKNNLQIISSLLYLQATRTEHPGAVSALRESRARIKSMALIHEGLYASPDLASVDMGKYTRSLVSNLRHSHIAEGSAVRLTLTIDDIPLGITEAIPCGLIINELVSNALKHAFPKGKEGEITIQLQRGSANQITLTVSDNGIGFPEHVDFRNSPSLGLTLINSLVEQLDGTIELDGRGGTAFAITFG